MPIKFSKDRWQLIQTILDEVLELDDDQQLSFLKVKCDGNQALYDDVSSLLSLNTNAPTFLEKPAFDLLTSINVAKKRTPQPLIETKIGPYVLCEELGHGGMGVVYRAERYLGDFEQQVAIKFLSNWHGDERLRARFSHEQKLLAKLDHSDIARIIDGGVSEQGQPYLIMEYIQGISIDKYCDQHRLGIDERLRLLMQVAEALGYAHSQLIVHRDIKASNILISADEEPKLLDFGVAKLLDMQADLTLTRTSEQIMTPGFAAPEQLSNGTISVATDVYQFGLLMYQLLTGRQAYQDQADSFAGLVNAICNREAMLPSHIVNQALSAVDSHEHQQSAYLRHTNLADLNKKLRGELDAIIMKTLAIKPIDRYQSMEALYIDLDAYFNHRPIAAHSQTTAYRLRKMLRRHWRPALISSAFVTLLSAYAITASLQAKRIEHALQLSLIEQKKTQSVADFMINIFKAADPNVSGLETITAGELLEQGQQRISTELNSTPAIQGLMLTSLGEIYYSQGDSEKSRNLLEQALAQQRLSGPGNKLAIAKTLTQLAIVHSTTNSYQQAEQYFEESRQLYDKFASTEVLAVSTDYAELLNSHGLLLVKQGKLDQAYDYLTQAIKTLRGLADEDHSELAVALNNLAHYYTVSGNLPAAKLSMQEAIEIHATTLGDYHSYFTVYLTNYGNLLTKLELYTEARPVFERALAIQIKLLGENHPYVSNTLRNLGVLEHAQGNLSSAEQHLRKALKIRFANALKDNLMTATIHLQLGLVLTDNEQFNKSAEQFFEMQKLHKTLNAGDHIIGLGMCAIARQAYRQGKLLHASNIYQQAIDTLSSAPLRRSIAQLGYAQTMLSMGEYNKAHTLADLSLRTRERELSDGHGLIYEAKAVISLIEFNQGSDSSSLLNTRLQNYYVELSQRPLFRYGGARSLHQQLKNAIAKSSSNSQR